VLYEGDEPSGERCAVRTAGSETGVQRGIPSVDGDKIGAVAVVEAELVLSTCFANSCGIHSHVDENILVEFPDGTNVTSVAIENVNP
jgi:hypothetical protein